MNNEQTRPTRSLDQSIIQSCIISGFPASERTYDFIPCYCLFSVISSDLPFKCSCLSLLGSQIRTSSPTVRIRFHFLSTFPTLKKTVVFNIIKGISLNTRLKCTSFPFPELSIWSNYVWYTLKGLKSSDPKKDVLLQVCTIQSQVNRCTGAIDTHAYRKILKYPVLTSSALSGILKVHRTRAQLDANGHRGLTLPVEKRLPRIEVTLFFLSVPSDMRNH